MPRAPPKGVRAPPLWRRVAVGVVAVGIRVDVGRLSVKTRGRVDAEGNKEIKHAQV